LPEQFTEEYDAKGYRFSGQTHQNQEHMTCSK
jgi:hypothetical protein